ncbi:hypothetical protein IH824_10745 [candidate division KSB1 bacterium]|nr:hypothetical protein [candidate division KSB1 bacterium]
MAHIDGRDPKSFNFENILFEKRGRRATVTINRPGVLNCVDLATLRELQLAFQDASWDDGISVVVLTGETDQELMHECMGLGTVMYLVKPMDIADVMNIVVGVRKQWVAIDKLNHGAA